MLRSTFSTDDRVVDHDAYGQHETEQREVVDDEREDQRDQDRMATTGRRARQLCEQVDDADHEEIAMPIVTITWMDWLTKVVGS
jgi:hypothetical protein